jgi:hypothetical protein
VALPPADDIMSPYGTAAESAKIRVERKIAELRAQAHMLERTLACYGGEAFVVKPEALDAPRHPFDAEHAILEVLRQRPDRVWIHGVEFVRDASGAFVKKD